jgi:polar amino acid transport system substrate-binding protein
MTATPRRRASRALRAASALALSGVLALGAGCSSADSDQTPVTDDVPALAVDAAAARQLPDAVRSAKVLRVAIPTNEPPTQFFKEGTRHMTGINSDIARLVGQALGVKAEIHVVNFDSIIPGMAAGRFDMTVSSMTPTTKRMAVLDFVDYMQVGNTIAVAKGNALQLDENTLCGRKVAFLTGSYQLLVDVPTYNTACQEAGRPAIVSSEYQDTRQAISALTSGRQDAVLADSPVLDYAASQNPDIEIASKFGFTPVAVGIPKDSGLVKPVSAAMTGMLTGDPYHAVLAKYGAGAAAITDARVNVAQ